MKGNHNSMKNDPSRTQIDGRWPSISIWNTKKKLRKDKVE